MAICYDLRFPELFRLLREKGADAVILPANWPAPRVAHWLTLGKARAIENHDVHDRGQPLEELITGIEFRRFIVRLCAVGRDRFGKSHSNRTSLNAGLWETRGIFTQPI
ncbi:MAG: hypothetical protein MZV63_15165 [Marinilabiliales bacterium]|nr:hypothetical protein [Marinilabiliales bacterium]